jgi:hypothetical protein
MSETPNSTGTPMIEAVREELRRFQSRQFDPAGYSGALDVYLAGGLAASRLF